MKWLKIQPLIENNFTQKDQSLMEEFFKRRDFVSMWEITIAELKKEAKISVAGKASERSCALQELHFHLTKQLEILGDIYD